MKTSVIFWLDFSTHSERIKKAEITIMVLWRDVVYGVLNSKEFPNFVVPKY
jgi:hypothetical protein